MSTKSCPRVGTDSRSHCAMQLEFFTNTETVKSFNNATQTDEAPAQPANGGSLARGECVNPKASFPGDSFSFYDSCGSSKWRRVFM